MAARRPDGTEITSRESRRLSTGLIVYGVVGLAIAIAMIVAVLLLRGSFGDVQQDVSAQVDRLETTIGKTAVSLRATADSVDGFVGTFERTSAGLVQVSGVVDGLSGVIGDLAGVFDAIRPLLGSVPALGNVAEQLGDLTPTIATITASMQRNEPQLERTADSLRDVAVQLDGVQRSLASGDLVTRVDEGFDFLRIAIIALAVWFAVPAVAALYVGISLRRAVSPATSPEAGA